jgi:hypothetical protein
MLVLNGCIQTALLGVGVGASLAEKAAVKAVAKAAAVDAKAIAVEGKVIAGEGIAGEAIAGEEVIIIGEGAAAEGGSKIADDVLITNPFDELGNLKPNTKYITGEFDYIYESDSLGRIEKFETDNLQLTARDSRLSHNPNTPGKMDGDHAGHIAGDIFGGSPDIDNLVSQSSSVNLSQYKKIENQWAKAIKEGKNVLVDVDIKYDGDSLRPSEFIVKYTIDGEYFEQCILN